MANISDITRDRFMLTGPLAKKGYDWWWHSFTGYHEKTGEQKSFFIEFFTANPALRGEAPTFGMRTAHPEEQPTDIPSYLMVKCGAWGEDAAQLHRFFGWKQVKLRRGTPFGIAGKEEARKGRENALQKDRKNNTNTHLPCKLTEKGTTGEVVISPEEAAAHPEWMSDAGSMRWKLKIDKKVAFHVGYGAASIFRKLNAFEMFWHAEGMKTAFTGWVEWNGERYLVRPEDCYGYSDKNWGGDFTSPWVWLSSNNLTSLTTGKKLNDSVFDIGGGCPKAFGIALKRKLLSDFWYEGKSYEFNFSKFWTGTRTRFSCEETDTKIIWHVDQETLRHRMITDITCERKDMLLFNYESPDGFKRHNRLWNGGNGRGTVELYKRKGFRWALIDCIQAENVGCEYGEYGKHGDDKKLGKD